MLQNLSCIFNKRLKNTLYSVININDGIERILESFIVYTGKFMEQIQKLYIKHYCKYWTKIYPVALIKDSRKHDGINKPYSLEYDLFRHIKYVCVWRNKAHSPYRKILGTDYRLDKLKYIVSKWNLSFKSFKG